MVVGDASALIERSSSKIVTLFMLGSGVEDELAVDAARRSPGSARYLLSRGCVLAGSVNPVRIQPIMTVFGVSASPNA